MTRVLVLGAGGMLGHKMFQRFPRWFETVGTVRRLTPALRELERLAGGRLVDGVDVEIDGSIGGTIRSVRPDVIVNGIGVIKQRPEAHDAARATRVNAQFPHELTRIAADTGARVIHIGTDCVFSGDRGNYRETDPPDPVDLYGRSKLDGEVSAENAITIRTSMIGRELSGFRSLLEWFLRQPRGSTVQGFTRAIFSGLTNIALADEIARLIETAPTLTGLYHVSTQAISKHTLLLMVRDAFAMECDIVPNATFHCDRSLLSGRYQVATGFTPPSWQSMISELAKDATPYASLTAAR